MIFISSIFIFCGIALYINKKNKLYADEAGTVFACFLFFAVVFAFAIAYFSPPIKTSTVHTIYKNKQNANATITLDNNTLTLDTQKTNKTKKNVDQIITDPRSQGCPRFQSGEELANSVGKINAC